MRRAARLLCVLAAAALPAAPAIGAGCPPPPDAPEKILILGNSLSGLLVPALAEAVGSAGLAKPLIVKEGVSGSSLASHLQRPKVGELVARNTWDVVVLQEKSAMPTRAGSPEAFKRAATELADLVREHSPCARVILFQTWVRRPGHPVYRKQFGSAEAMHAELRANYRDAAERYLPEHMQRKGGPPVELAPAGDAWHAAAAEGLLDIYARDGVHQAKPGAYLNGLVLFSTLYRRSAAGARDWEIEPGLARKLRILADRATGYPR